MANLFDITATCSSSSPPDDISLFLRQILLKSSSSSSATSFSSSPSAVATKQMQCEIPSLQPLYSSGLPVPSRIHTTNPNLPVQAYVSSSSVGTADNDADEYDCESEEGGFEALTEEMAAKSNPTRNPAKRTRAAEVHNMSEKRRRSRINEKMKALQKLIPNSNKTDKASMLDEAIEYLKQLQLRVQMLTMKNGINLYSMPIPSGVFEPHQIPPPHSSTFGFNEAAAANMTSLNQQTPVNPIIQCTNQAQLLSIPDLSYIINPLPSTSSSFRDCLISNHGSEGAQLMNSHQKLVLPVDLDRSCTRNESK